MTGKKLNPKANSKNGIIVLANKIFKSEKVRNIISIIAIALTTLLFTSLFTLGSGVIEQLEINSMRQSGSSAHGIIKFLTSQQYKEIKNHPLIDKIGYECVIGDIKNKELIKQTTFFVGADQNGIVMNFSEPIAGKVPEKENDILIDIDSLNLLGIPLEIGSPVLLKFSVNGVEYENEFTLSGYYNRDPRVAVIGIYCSPLYAENFLQELKSIDKASEINLINAKIMFHNKSSIIDKLQTVITDSGYSIIEGDDNYLSYNDNWAYIQTGGSMDSFVVIILLFILLLIGLTGYLIIYNIFQISIMQDIRLYGLLKTIGATQKHTEIIIVRQLLRLAIWGIPLGLLLGYFLGVMLMPLYMKQSDIYYEGLSMSVSANPLIFIGSSIFSLITILISIRKPCNIAAKVSPIEALRFNNVVINTAKKRRVKKLSTMRMARANLMRNKKQVILTVISLSLSLVLLNSLVTMISSFNMTNYISRYIKADFNVAHAQYFQFGYNPADHSMDEQIISEIEHTKGFLYGGRVYTGSKNINKNPNYFIEPQDSQTEFINEQGYYNTDIYGADEYILEGFKLLDGEFNIGKLDSGDYMLEAIIGNDKGSAHLSNAHYQVGDIVKLYYNNESWENEIVQYKEVEIIGHIQINWSTDTKRYFNGQIFYTSASGIKNFIDEPAVMSYAFWVDESQKNQMEEWMNHYTTDIADELNYESEQIYVEKFNSLKNTTLIVGVLLSAIIGFIGITNFVNCILTSIFVRKREFTIMQSIGMTKGQLISMLSLEGLHYAVYTSITSMILGTGISVILLRFLSGLIWFMNYRFTLLPIAVCSILLIIFGLLIPVCIYMFSANKTIAERLQSD